MFQLALILAATVALGVHGKIYPPVDPNCSPLISSGVSAAERVTILNKHNELRSRVAKGLETRGSPGPQPKASNMRKMIWSNELAAKAQRRASQCTIVDDTWGKVAISSSVGQNIQYMTGSKFAATIPNWAATVTQWFDEVELFDKSRVSSYTSSSDTGRYTQVVWANTYLVGCGYAQFRASNGIYFQSIYVCNYAPVGNIIGSPMYKVGNPCSQCPPGTTCSSAAEGLCKI